MTLKHCFERQTPAKLKFDVVNYNHEINNHFNLMTDLSWILRPMLFSTNEQAYIPFRYEVVTSWLCKCIQSRNVNPYISGDSLAPCIWRAVFLCLCSVMNCTDSDHFCCWFSGLHFVYQIMSQWFIIIIRVVIKSSPAKLWRSSLKSLDLKAKSSRVIFFI